MFKIKKYNGEIVKKYLPFFKVSNEEAINLLLKNGKTIKSDNKRDVSIINLSYNNNSIKVIVKRFKYKNKFEAFFKIFIFKKMKKLFKKNIVLNKMQIYVPDVIAYFNSYKNNESFLLFQYLDNSIDFGMYCIRNNNFIETSVKELLVKRISNLHKKFIVHGDLKWSNMILLDDNMFFVDTEALVIYSKLSLSRLMQDLKRFFRFAIEIGCVKWLQDEFFPEYLENLPDNIKKCLDYNILYNAALKDFYKKRKGINPGELFKNISYTC